MTRKQSRLSLAALLLSLVAAGCTLRDAVTTEAEAIYAALMCNCGCNQVLGVCNHIGCPNAVPMRAEVDGHLAAGLDTGEVLALFADKYGVGILSAPPTTGWFNVSGWVMPFFALALGLGALAYYLRRFRGRRIDAESPAADTAGVTLERLEDELAEFDPKN